MPRHPNQKVDMFGAKGGLRAAENEAVKEYANTLARVRAEIVAAHVALDRLGAPIRCPKTEKPLTLESRIAAFWAAGGASIPGDEPLGTECEACKAALKRRELNRRLGERGFDISKPAGMRVSPKAGLEGGRINPKTTHQAMGRGGSGTR